MRILLITDNHAPSGGAEKYFFDLKERLKKMPDVEVYSMGFGPVENTGEDFSVFKSLNSNVMKLMGRIMFHPFMYFKLRKQIKKINPDVIHIHNVKQYSMTLLSAIKSYPVVQTIHDHSIICPTAQNIHKDQKPCPTGMTIKCFFQHQIKYNFFIYFLLAFSFYKIRNCLRKTVKKFITVSPLLAQYLIHNRFADVTYVPPFKMETPPCFFENIKPYHFLFIGSLATHKGIDILFDEFALACRKNDALFLNVVGSGPEEESIRKKIQELKIQKHCQLLGWQKNPASFYKENIAVIFPSIGLEGFPLVITEAMNHARPIIGVNRGSTAWLVDDKKTGLLFDPLKKGDLAEKILDLAGNIELAKQFGTNGAAKIQDLIDNEEALNKIILIYKDAILA